MGNLSVILIYFTLHVLKLLTQSIQEISSLRMAIIKTTQITNVGKDVEKKESSYTAGGNLNWCSHGRYFLKKLKSELPPDSVIPQKL